MIKPFNNNVLIEIIREDDGVARSFENESMRTGKLVDFSVSRFHLTASAGAELSEDFIKEISSKLTKAMGKDVRWEEFAEGGQTIERDNKTFALIPWWRLIGIEE